MRIHMLIVLLLVEGMVACHPHLSKSPSTTAATYTKEGYRLVWSDEFDKTGQPDSSKWNYEHGFVRNEEWQWVQSF